MCSSSVHTIACGGIISNITILSRSPCLEVYFPTSQLCLSLSESQHRLLYISFCLFKLQLACAQLNLLLHLVKTHHRLRGRRRCQFGLDHCCRHILSNQYPTASSSVLLANSLLVCAPLTSRN